jgi:hypothetical protein
MKRILAGLALLAAAAGLAGCGATSLVSDPVASAASKSTGAGGAKVAVRIEISSPALGDTVVTANGLVDQDEGQVSIDLSGLASKLPPAFASAATGVDVLYDTENGDPVVYAHVPFLAGMIPGGKEWVKLDVQKAAGAAGVNLGNVLGQAGSNPVQILDLLRQNGTVAEVGHETVDGVATTRYHAAVDLEKALTAKGVPQATVDEILAAGAPAQLPVDVWIGDDDGLVHEVQSTLAVPSQQGDVTTVTTVKLSDWGTPVAVEPPPSDQVYAAN